MSTGTSTTSGTTSGTTTGSTTGADTVAARRRRHLMDPAHPVRPVNDRSLSQVQRYVMSTLTAFTAFHLGVGLVVAALEVPASETAARIGLNVIAGAFGVLAVLGALAIHHRRLLSPWLLVGPLMTAVGLYLTFR